MKNRFCTGLFLAFALLPNFASADSSDFLFLDSKHLILLPYFDAEILKGEKIDRIFLTLHLLESNIQGKTIELRFNPINPNTLTVREGFSREITIPPDDENVDVPIPIELFLESRPGEMFAISLVDENSKLLFQGINTLGVGAVGDASYTVITNNGTSVFYLSSSNLPSPKNIDSDKITCESGATCTFVEKNAPFGIVSIGTITIFGSLFGAISLYFIPMRRKNK